MGIGEVPGILKGILPTTREIQLGIKANVKPCVENPTECIGNCQFCERADKLHEAFIGIGSRSVSEKKGKGWLTISQIGSFETRGATTEIMFDLK